MIFPRIVNIDSNFDCAIINYLNILFLIIFIKPWYFVNCSLILGEKIPLKWTKCFVQLSLKRECNNLSAKTREENHEKQSEREREKGGEKERLISIQRVEAGGWFRRTTWGHQSISGRVLPFLPQGYYVGRQEAKEQKSWNNFVSGKCGTIFFV